MNKIDTTVNIHISLLEEILKAANKVDIKANDIVIMLFRRMLQEKDRFFLHKKTIQYQDPCEDYKIFHIYLSEIQYEQKLDMRRMYKMSSSMLLAFAITKILGEILYNLLNKNPNVLENDKLVDHFINKEASKDTTLYTILWINYQLE